MCGEILSKCSKLFSYHLGVLMRIDGKKEFPRTDGFSNENKKAFKSQAQEN